MKCQGRPDGICPDNRNDSTVHNTIADLFLCHACEEYRWPPLSSKKTSKGGCNDTTDNKSSRKQKTAANNVSANTRGKGKSLQQNDSAKAKDIVAAASLAHDTQQGDMSDTEEYCPICDEVVDKCTLKCDICESGIHMHCSGLPSDVAHKLLSIINYTGWVCPSCRSDNRQHHHGTVQQLQRKLGQVTEQLSDVLVKIDVLEKQLATVPAGDAGNQEQAGTHHRQTAPKQHRSQSTANNNEASSIAVEVHRTLADATRRKANVVVSGLPESSDRSQDEQSFLELCERHFSVKPSVSKYGCRRLGKSENGSGRPRKLLVHLESESSVNILLKEARLLRSSDDAVISSSVYINPDLSPAKLQLAYEHRLRKRMRQQNGDQNRNSNSNTSTAPTVVTAHPVITQSSPGMTRPNDTSFRQD